MKLFDVLESAEFGFFGETLEVFGDGSAEGGDFAEVVEEGVAWCTWGWWGWCDGRGGEPSVFDCLADTEFLVGDDDSDEFGLQGVSVDVDLADISAFG